MASGGYGSTHAAEFRHPILTSGSDRIRRPSWDPEIELEFGVTDLARIRRMVRTVGLDAGLSDEKADALVIAVNEITTNAVVHGRPPAVLRVWTSADDVLCEVRDAGHGIDDEFAGQVLPVPDSVGGRGLWLARVLCDDLDIGRDGESAVSLRMAA
jgi:anti-sigma regulatory factor (Ser/Thr protein kinase)